MKALKNEKGFIKPLLIILVLAFFAYAGFQFAMPYYRHAAMKSEAKEVARISLGREDKLRSMIMAAIDEYKIPINQDSIWISKTASGMHVRMQWSEEVDILGFYQKRLYFDIDVIE
ncbi:MAG: hypothetical protein JSV21_10405 [Nitrospirota bacterium]|nr:MAG: hypothetical protein JSV21_10405 [Nitrospirota bacterium]